MGCISFIIWMSILAFGIRIEKAWRAYQYGILSIIEAVGEALFFYMLCIEIDRSNRLRFLNIIGRNTIWILAVHFLDGLEPFVRIWYRESLPLRMISRIIFDLAVALLISVCWRKLCCLRGKYINN